MLNIRQQTGERYTLVFQIIRQRQRAVIFSSYRLLLREFAPEKGQVQALSRRRADRARAEEINGFIREQTEEIRRLVARMEQDGESFTARDIAVACRQRYDRHFVHIFFREQIEELEQRGRMGTATSYRSTLTVFRKFSGGRAYRFEELTETVLVEFERFLLLSELQRNTRTFYMRVLRAVFNKAKRLGIVHSGQAPFEAVSFREDATEKLAVSADVLKKVFSAVLDDPGQRAARDLFMFSFYARGMSFVDMAYLRREQIADGYIRYKRRKTGQPFVVKLTLELEQLLDQYEWCAPWALPIMVHGKTLDTTQPVVRFAAENDKEFCKRLHFLYKKSLSRYTQYLEGISSRLKLSEKLTFNVARHSWATLAQDKGIPLSVISKGLGHTSETTTQIYLAELDARKVNEANDIVTNL